MQLLDEMLELAEGELAVGARLLDDERIHLLRPLFVVTTTLSVSPVVTFSKN